jgi:hypothetical protein
MKRYDILILVSTARAFSDLANKFHYWVMDYCGRAMKNKMKSAG